MPVKKIKSLLLFHYQSVTPNFLSGESFTFISATTTPMNTSQKLQILESLHALDAAQAEKVLDYIRQLRMTSGEENRYRLYKRQAMKEIRKALRTDRHLKSDK